MSAHTADDVDSYVNAEGRLRNLHERQFRRIADALRKLFCEIISMPRSADYGCHRWRAFARTRETDRATPSREVSGASLTPPGNNPSVKCWR